ncbi:hypothetical protein EDD15DRAFT_2517560 [Pisolithus albus]|nr:hypothetical protein EDD15DRAFT_2517560 [Pisolithus albus]
MNSMAGGSNSLDGYDIMNGPTLVAMLERVLEQFPGLQGRKRLHSTGNLLSVLRWSSGYGRSSNKAIEEVTDGYDVIGRIASSDGEHPCNHYTCRRGWQDPRHSNILLPKEDTPWTPADLDIYVPQATSMQMLNRIMAEGYSIVTDGQLDQTQYTHRHSWGCTSNGREKDEAAPAGFICTLEADMVPWTESSTSLRPRCGPATCDGWLGGASAICARGGTLNDSRIPASLLVQGAYMLERCRISNSYTHRPSICRCKYDDFKESVRVFRVS